MQGPTAEGTGTARSNRELVSHRLQAGASGQGAAESTLPPGLRGGPASPCLTSGAHPAVRLCLPSTCLTPVRPRRHTAFSPCVWDHVAPSDGDAGHAGLARPPPAGPRLH